MSTRWRVLDLIDYAGYIDVKTGRVLINEQEVAMSDVACVLTGTRTKWTGSFVHIAAKYDVPLIACDWRGIPISTTLPWSENSRVGARHRAQASLSLPRQKNAWMRIVKAKINGQANNLAIDPVKRSKLLEMSKKVRSGDPDNYEARAARTYWGGVFGEEKFVRNPDLDGRNAFLNYGYTILRGGVIRAVSVAGLAPALGIFHRNRSNAFALADDLIEPFRPAVDFLVASLSLDTNLKDRTTKAHLVSVLSHPLVGSGETVMSAISSFAQAFASYVEGDSDSLVVPVWIP